MQKTAIIAALVTILAASSTAASASIVCNGDYQSVNGVDIATPYCESENLARNARLNGVHVSGQTLRANDSARINACNEPGASQAACSDRIY